MTCFPVLQELCFNDAAPTLRREPIQEARVCNFFGHQTLKRTSDLLSGVMYQERIPCCPLQKLCECQPVSWLMQSYRSLKVILGETMPSRAFETVSPRQPHVGIIPIVNHLWKIHSLYHSECSSLGGWRDGESHETQLHGLRRGVLG